MKRRLISIFLVIMLFGCSVASATEYGTPASGTYTSIGGGSYKGYYYSVYKINTVRNRIYENKKLTPVIYHTKNTGEDQLSYSTSQSLSSESVVSYNANIGITVSVGAVNITANAGCGSTTTKSKTVNSSAGVTKVIPSSANSGYYVRVLGRTYYDVKVIAQNMNSRYNDTYYYKMPFGDPVIYTAYSTSNANGSYEVY